MLYVIAIITFVLFSFVPAVEAENVHYVFGFVLFLIGIIIQLVAYYNHLSDMENIKKLAKDKEIYKQQADDLLAEIRLYLIEKFPEHESKIFDKITGNTVDFLAVDYPEIKANETFTKAVKSIVELKGKIYDCDLNINTKTSDLNIRKRAMGLTCLPLLPKVEEQDV